MADGDVHEEVPAVLSQVRNEQVGPLPVVYSQACGVRQRLDVGLDCIVPVCQQGFEFQTGPQVAGVGPVDDLVFPATASGGELVEGEAQSQTAALPECFPGIATYFGLFLEI